MDIRLSKDELKNILLLLPFFEPYSIDMLSINNPMWKYVGLLFACMRYAVSIYAVVMYAWRGLKPNSRCGMLCACVVVIRVLSSIINNSVYLTYYLGAFSFIGLILLCDYLAHKKDPYYLVKILLCLFAVYTAAGVITIIAFPNGFNKALYKHEALYLLGSKNSSFYYFYVFLGTFVLYSISAKKLKRVNNTLITIALFIVCLGSERLCDSSNGFGSTIILFMFYLIVRFSYLAYKIVYPKTLMVSIAVITLLLLFKNSIPLFNLVFSALGRDASLTGRDYIWAQQLPLIKDAAIFGNGINVDTVLQSSAVANHAHNFYLDTVVKYGVLSLFTLIIVILVSADNIVKFSNNKYQFFLAGMLFSLLLHSIFDDVSLYLLFSVLMLTENRYLSSKKRFIVRV